VSELFTALPDGLLCRIAYFSQSWTAFQADRGRRFKLIVDAVSRRIADSRATAGHRGERQFDGVYRKYVRR
jgi:hypothetical protein